MKKLVQSFFDVRRSAKTLQKWSPTTFFRRIVTPLIRVVTPFIASRGPSHMKHCTFIQCTKVGNKHVLQIWFYSIFRRMLRVRNDGTNWEHDKKKRWRNQKSKKASPGFLRFFQNSTLMEFPHIICLNNHHFLEHRVTPVLKSPTPKKTPPLKKKKRAVLFFLRKPPELRKNSAPNAGYPEWRCWGLTSIYFLKGNRRQNTPARSSWTVWVSCGCFCFKSSRFFSTIFLDPQKRFGFFSGENPSNWLMSDRQVLPRWSLVSFTPAVDDEISKEYRPSSPVIHGFQWKNCWDKFERYLQTNMAIAGRSSFFCRRYSCFFHCHVSFPGV